MGEALSLNGGTSDVSSCCQEAGTHSIEWAENTTGATMVQLPLMPIQTTSRRRSAEGASGARPSQRFGAYAQGVPPTNAATDPRTAHSTASRNFIGIVLSCRTYEDLTIPGPESRKSI